MATKYYRVKKDTFLWEAGAIIQKKDGQDGYRPVEDIWNVSSTNPDEYISTGIIEHPRNEGWFERVYPDTIGGTVYRTIDQLKAAYNDKFVKE